MTSRYPCPSNETERLAALERLQIVGTPRAADFDSVLALALQISGCAAGSIGLMEEHRHWFKAECGFGFPEVSRELSLCNHALLQRSPLVVEDLLTDPRFSENPLVLRHQLRFYAGVPLGSEGLNVGTLCLVDSEPRLLAPEVTAALRHLGLVIEGLLDAHAQAAKATSLAKTAEAREQDIWRQSRLLIQSERLAKVGAWEFDFATKTFFLSDEACRIHDLNLGTHRTLDEYQGKMEPEAREQAIARFARCIETGEGYEYRGKSVTVKGRSIWVHVIAETELKDGKVVRIFGTVRDVTAEHMAEQALWRAAHYDALTEAPNRHFWTSRLEQAFARAEADQTDLTILMFDLDGFKEINDTRGHAVGDAVLCNLAKRLGDTLPNGAFHARLGGDEFAVLLEGAWPAGNVETLVRQLLIAIQAPIRVGELGLQISGTFGSATYPADASNASDLMQRADIALYQAKRSHRSSFVSFRREIGDLFYDKRHAIDLVAAAIAQNRLVPFYQPKFDLKTGDSTGFEALCRIEAEDGTILGPSQFMPALADPASSARIGTAMLHLVTADIAAWMAAGLTPGRIALNVAGSDFADGALATRVLARLEALSLPSSAIEIEVTENIILGKEAALVEAALQAMSDSGIVIALDDFGTGYASLTHLRDAPIRYLKLDQSFIAGLGRGADSAIIVRSIVDLGHSLGMKIVAEGIETDGQAEFLRAIGCDEGQGFLFGRPASGAATRRTLKERQSSDVPADPPFLIRYFDGAARRSAIENLVAGLHRRS